MDKRIAVVLASDFEDSEFASPRHALEEAGYTVVVIGRQAGEELAGKRGEVSTVSDRAAADTRAGDFDGLLIPGGYSPDKLRTDEDVVRFVRDCADEGLPIAAICHGPQLLIEAHLVQDRTLTSWPSVRTDLINAGARWIDEPVVEHGPLITARKPDDLDAFNSAFLRRIEERRLAHAS
jgi:protease I